MNRFEETPQSPDVPVEQRLKEFSAIDSMPEGTYEEVHAKWISCNNAILKIGDFLPQIHGESGGNSLDDQGVEDAEDTRERGLAGEMMSHFRDEMARLGDKLESLQKAP